MDVGLQQFLDYGVGASITATCGKVTSGEVGPNDSALVHREGIGAQDDVVGGAVAFGGNQTFTVESELLLAYALRSSFTTPSLTDLTFAGGKNLAGRQHTGAKIDTLALHCAFNEGLTADIAWLATSDAAYATAPKGYNSDKTWEWGGASAVMPDSMNLQVQSWDLNINNNLSLQYYQDTSKSGARRWPDAIHVGSQEVTLRADVLVQPDATIIDDIIGDTLGVALTATLTLLGGTSGTDTMTIALTSLSRKSAPVPLSAGGGLITYSMEWEAKKDASVISISVAA